MQLVDGKTSRFLQLHSKFGGGNLNLTKFSGSEHVSAIYNFELEAVSNSPNFTLEDVLYKLAAVQINSLESQKPRFYHGVISSFREAEIKEGIRTYNFEMVPAICLLNFSSDCRIFQNKTVIEIIKELLQEYNINDYDFSNVKGQHIKREYCVQYREKTLDFIERLLAEEGIFYYFCHEQDKHVWVLSDQVNYQSCNQEPVVFTAGSHKGHCITEWKSQRKFYSGGYQHTDYNFQTPDISLFTHYQVQPKLNAAKTFNVYDYPGGYQDMGLGQTLGQRRFESHQANYESVNGAGNYQDFTAGCKFTFNKPPAGRGGEYLITSVYHYVTDNTSMANFQTNSQVYHNLFSCMPADIPFRPLAKIEKPFVKGPQTAFVVGPEGEEIYTDPYGRIKVQFHWDQLGSRNEYSSCWLRVAQLWAGNRWGSIFIPRIGQEVIVHFLEGDPDRPIVVGSVYNANQMPPYALPDLQTRSGIKTRSTKDGGENDANELRFEDKKGQEEVYLHAQKDFKRHVENDEIVAIKQDQLISIDRAHSLTASTILMTAEEITLQVGASKIQITPASITIESPRVIVNNN